MEAVLEILLEPERELHSYVNRDDWDKALDAAVEMRDDAGITLLGHAVAWGYEEAARPILDAVG